jgi:hypothetical protein
VTPSGASVETLEGSKAQEGIGCLPIRGNTRAAARIHCWRKALEARPSRFDSQPIRTASRRLAAVAHS